MSNYTAGEWVAYPHKERHNDRAGFIVLEKKLENAKNICTVIAGTDMSAKETEANARLIVSAPEMLAVIKEVLMQLDHNYNGECYNPLEDDCQCTLCKINRVINKAEG